MHYVINNFNFDDFSKIALEDYKEFQEKQCLLHKYYM